MGSGGCWEVEAHFHIQCFKIDYVLKSSIEFGRSHIYTLYWFIIFRFFGKRRQWDCRGASNLEELHQLLSEIMIRRLKNDVLTQLPPKVRQRIPFDLPQAAAKVNFPLLLKIHLLINADIYVWICIFCMHVYCMLLQRLCEYKAEYLSHCF